MANVSVPEKTLEHWSSLYLTYRYRSKAAMWWPTTGVDIDVRWLPHCPGKAVQLELKTTVVAGTHYQDVLLNLGQLWDYANLPLGQQPFYVFPWPEWEGGLEAVASSANIPASELAFSRSGSNWWFASWMVVLTTQQVKAVLSKELAAHGSPTRAGASCRLVRFDLTPGAGASLRTWGTGAAEPDCTAWRDFWSTLELCGRDGWGQLIRLPATAVTARGYRRTEVAGLLEEFHGVDRREWRGVDLVTLAPFGGDSPGASDVFRVIDDPAGADETGSRQPTGDDVDGGLSDRRQVAFIQAGVRRRRT